MTRKYIVGSYQKNDDGSFDVPLFYQDTRFNERYAEDGCSNIFTSSGSGYWVSATRYDTLQEAEAWNQEFLRGEGRVYRVFV